MRLPECIMLRHAAGLGVVFACLLGGACAMAQQSGPPRAIVAVGAEADSESAKRLVAAFDWALRDRTWVQGTASWTDVPHERGDVATRSLDLGLEQRFGPIGVLLTGGYWGDPDALETWRYGASLIYIATGWRASIGLARRDIDVTFAVTTPAGAMLERTASLHDEEISVALRYGGERWGAYINATDFDYSRDLRAIADLPIRRLRRLVDLSGSALTLADSFLDYSMTLGLDRRFGLHALNVEYGRDKTLIEGVRADALSLGWLAPLGSRSDLELRLGYSDADALGSSVFGGILVLFYIG